jgi:integrase
MSDALSTLTSPAEITAYEAVLRDAARDFAEHATAESTERAYASAWRSFGAFTATLGRSHLPADPQTVADYVAALALRGRTPATIRAYLAAIAVYHRAAGHESPVSHGVVRAVMQGVRRTLGVAPKKKDALVREQLLDVVAAIPEDDLRGLRDRAMLLLGWAGALRRSEIGALDVEDVTFAPEGAIVDLRRSKTDQIGSGARIPIPRASTPEVACGREHLGWSALSRDRSPRARRCSPLRSRRREHRSGASTGHQHRRPLAAIGLCDKRRPRRSHRGRDHAAWPLEIRRGRTRVYPRRHSVGGVDSGALGQPRKVSLHRAAAPRCFARAA